MLIFSISFRVASTISKMRTCNSPWRLQPQSLAWWRFNNSNFHWGCNTSYNTLILQQYYFSLFPNLFEHSAPGLPFFPRGLKPWSPASIGHSPSRCRKLIAGWPANHSALPTMGSHQDPTWFHSKSRACCMKRPQETQMAQPQHTFRNAFRNNMQPRFIEGLRPGVMLYWITCVQSRCWMTPVYPWTIVNRFCVNFFCRGNQHCNTYISFLNRLSADPARPALSFMTLVAQSPRLNRYLWRGGPFKQIRLTSKSRFWYSKI